MILKTSVTDASLNETCSPQCCRTFYHSRIIWTDQLRRIGRDRHLAPHSFAPSVVKSWSTDALRATTFCDSRLESTLSKLPSELSYSPVAREDQFELSIDSSGVILEVELLPGGRWAYGEVRWADGRRGVVCWDLAQLCSSTSQDSETRSRVLSPVAEIAASFPSTNLDPEEHLVVQLGLDERSVNFLFAYVPVRDDAVLGLPSVRTLGLDSGRFVTCVALR